MEPLRRPEVRAALRSQLGSHSDLHPLRKCPQRVFFSGREMGAIRERRGERGKRGRRREATSRAGACSAPRSAVECCSVRRGLREASGGLLCAPPRGRRTGARCGRSRGEGGGRRSLRGPGSRSRKGALARESLVARRASPRRPQKRVSANLHSLFRENRWGSGAVGGRFTSRRWRRRACRRWW